MKKIMKENMIYRKGQFLPGNAGKPKGAINKITREIRKSIEQVLEIIQNNHLEKDIEKIKPIDRVRLWIDLQEYIRPKLQRLNVELDAEQRQITKITFEIKEMKNGNKDRGDEDIPKELRS